MIKSLTDAYNSIYKVCECGLIMEYTYFPYVIIQGKIVKNIPYLQCECGIKRSNNLLIHFLGYEIKQLPQKVLDFKKIAKIAV